MVVEDDPDIAAILELSLQNIGMLETTLFPDAYAALAALEQQQPDMVLMDVMMPGLSGIDALPRVRQTRGGRDCVVIFITANASPTLLAECIECGAAGVITKPFDVVGLATTLKDLWLEHNTGLPGCTPSVDGGAAPCSSP
jgi:CheY-like chemotaxis protein